MRSILLTLLIAVLAGCTCAETTVSLGAPPAPLAVSASGVVHLTARTCRTFAFDKRGNVGKSDTVCSSEGVEVGEAWVDDPSTFEVTADRTFVQVKALLAGATTLHAREKGGALQDTYETQLEARTTNRLELDFNCDAGTPLGIVVGSRFDVSVSAFADEVALLGVPARPLSSPLLTTPAGASPTTFVASSTPGLDTVRSDHDARLAVPIRVFEVREAVLEVPAPLLDLWGAGTATFLAFLTVDARRACVDPTVYRFETLTPEVCDFGKDAQGRLQLAQERYAGAGAVAKRVAPGDCTVRVSAVDHPEVPAAERTHTF